MWLYTASRHNRVEAQPRRGGVTLADARQIGQTLVHHLLMSGGTTSHGCLFFCSRSLEGEPEMWVRKEAREVQ